MPGAGLGTRTYVGVRLAGPDLYYRDEQLAERFLREIHVEPRASGGLFQIVKVQLRHVVACPRQGPAVRRFLFFASKPPAKRASDTPHSSAGSLGSWSTPVSPLL